MPIERLSVTLRPSLIPFHIYTISEQIGKTLVVEFHLGCPNLRAHAMFIADSNAYYPFLSHTHLLSLSLSLPLVFAFRSAMFGITVGLLTEYWTGQSIPQQIETLVQVLGLVPLDYESYFS